MRFWFAMHYPHYAVDEAEWFIYVPRGHEHKVASFEAGDRVAFYEVGFGPDRRGKPGKRPPGAAGIVCLASGSGKARATSFREETASGEITEFTLECPCRDHIYQHLLPREEMFIALKRKLNLHGLGGGAGFIELSRDEFSRIESAFMASPLR